MYHVSTQGVEEHMINVHIIIIIPLFGLTLVVISLEMILMCPLVIVELAVHTVQVSGYRLLIHTSPFA